MLVLRHRVDDAFPGLVPGIVGRSVELQGKVLVGGKTLPAETAV